MGLYKFENHTSDGKGKKKKNEREEEGGGGGGCRKKKKKKGEEGGGGGGGGGEIKAAVALSLSFYNGYFGDQFLAERL